MSRVSILCEAFVVLILVPTRFDLWFAALLGKLLGRSELFDRSVQSAIRHNVLGGFWFAAALFILWALAARSSDAKMRVRLLTTLVGSGLAVLLTLICGEIIEWPPPANFPGLAKLFPPYLDLNPNTNCFPSQSTAVYTCVAAGVYSIQRSLGWLLWVVVPVAVSLPRMYVGGHYATDILAGLILGLAGYGVTRSLLETRLISKADEILDSGPRLRLVRDLLVFTWILQIAVEFRDAVWVQYSAETLLHWSGHL